MTVHWFHWTSWAGQLVAAALWLVSVLVHGAYDAHDVLQMLASLSWLGASFAQAVALRHTLMAEPARVRGTLGAGPVREPPPVGFSLVL